MITVITAEDIMKLTGYSKSQAQKLVREAKLKLVSEGFNWYENKRVGRVPAETIESILGFSLFQKNDIIQDVLWDAVTIEGAQNNYDSN